jgi:hypothetical protein
MLFAVVCDDLPPYEHRCGQKIVSLPHLIRDLLGFYGLRMDLLVEIESKLHDTNLDRQVRH